MTKFKDLKEYTNKQADSLKVNILEIEGRRYLDIRKYYRDGGKYKPTKKGVMLDLEQFEHLFKTLQGHQGDIRTKLGE